MKLCGASLSPFYERNALALELKGQAEAVECPGVPGGFKSAEHLALCPTGKIPFLIRDDGSVLIESQVIAEYLDAVLPGSKLLPADPDARAQVQLVCRIIDLYVVAGMGPMTAAMFRGIRDEEKIARAKAEDFPAAVNLLGHALARRGKYAVGDSWTLADCALIPVMFYFLNGLNAFGIDALAINADVAAWWNGVKDEPIVKTSHARMKAMLDAMMSGAKAS